MKITDEIFEYFCCRKDYEKPQFESLRLDRLFTECLSSIFLGGGGGVVVFDLVNE